MNAFDVLIGKKTERLITSRVNFTQICCMDDPLHKRDSVPSMLTRNTYAVQSSGRAAISHLESNVTPLRTARKIQSTINKKKSQSRKVQKKLQFI